MLVAYRVLGGLLAAFSLSAGGVELARSRKQLPPTTAWVDTTPTAGVRTIGALEVLGAIGLVLPPLTGVAPWLALVAAIRLAVLQVAAPMRPLTPGDRAIAIDVVAFALAVVVAVLGTVRLR